MCKALEFEDSISNEHLCECLRIFRKFAQEKESAFQRDIRNYTVEFARTVDEHDIESFQRDLGAIAEGYGITDWERTQDTFVAIGRGLGESELDEPSAKQLAVALSNEDYDHLMLIRSGYENRNTR